MHKTFQNDNIAMNEMEVSSYFLALGNEKFLKKKKFVFNWKRLHKVVMMMWIKCRLYYRAAWHGKKIHSCHWAEGLCQLYLIYSDPSLHCGLKSIKKRQLEKLSQFELMANISRIFIFICLLPPAKLVKILKLEYKLGLPVMSGA